MAGRAVGRWRPAGLVLRSVGGNGRCPRHVVAGCVGARRSAVVRPGARGSVRDRPFGARRDRAPD